MYNDNGVIIWRILGFYFLYIFACEQIKNIS